MASYESKRCTSCNRKFEWLGVEREFNEIRELEVTCPRCGTVHKILSQYHVTQVRKSL